jgi:MFS family permease
VHAADAHAARPLLHYLLSRPVLGVALAFFSFNYVLYFFLSWLPSYLTDYQHLNIKQMSVVGILPWLGATVGFVAGGTVSDRIYRHSGDVLFARKIVIVVGLGVAAACVLLASRVNSLGAAVTLIAIASLFAFMAPQACWSLLQEIVPRERVGAAGGFVHLLANLAGILSPSLTGWLVQYGGGYAGAFVLAGASALAGAAILTVAVRPRTVAQMRGAV